MTRRFDGALALLLGTEPRMRARLGMWVVGAFTYVVYCTLLALQVHLGFADVRGAWVFGALAVAANVFVYAAVRSGAAMRWRFDPGLARSDLWFGIVMFWVGYLLAGPSAVTQLIVIASHIVYAVFSMSPAQVRRLAAVSLLGLATVMLVGHAMDPARFPAGPQLVAFGYAALVVPLLARLAGTWSSLNATLRSQKAELRDALARLHDLATRDELTQLHNRRHLLELVQLMQRQMSRLPHECSLALLDLDHFKRINDAHGHQAGDAVLRAFAEAARRGLRTSDLFGRWGGEEFLVVLPGSGWDAACTAIERVRRELSATPAAVPGVQVTFSAGVTLLRPGESIDEAISRADTALYSAKALGRNRTEVAMLPAALPAGQAAFAQSGSPT